ncbi:MAG TPA: nucleotidyltransferase family protein [Candidatus Binatia bacterium]|nr:nucleotidyltransferase family protein [Candidatus Binatia bacterium]
MTPSRAHQPPLLALLRAGLGSEVLRPMAPLAEDAVRWAIATGLGPLVMRATGHDPAASTSPAWPLVRAACLTARALTALQMDATSEIIEACRRRAPPLVLLKGISLCEAYYPEPHLRPMRDIDVLVEEPAVPAVEAVLADLGYRQESTRPAAFYEGHHHSSPFVHPDTGIWVDVHRAVVTSRSELAATRAFRSDNLAAELRASTFRGGAVRRLSDELQIVHVACHWARGLRVVGGMTAMADVICLLGRRRILDWERILGWVEASPASRHLGLLLSYLHRWGLIALPAAIAARLVRSPAAPSRLTARLGYLLVDRYVVNGREFGSVISERTFSRLWNWIVLGKPGRARGG